MIKKNLTNNNHILNLKNTRNPLTKLEERHSLYRPLQTYPGSSLTVQSPADIRRIVTHGSVPCRHSQDRHSRFSPLQTFAGSSLTVQSPADIRRIVTHGSALCRHSQDRPQGSAPADIRRKNLTGKRSHCTTHSQKCFGIICETQNGIPVKAAGVVSEHGLFNGAFARFEVCKVVGHRVDIVSHVEDVVPDKPTVQRVGNELGVRHGPCITRLELEDIDVVPGHKLDQLLELCTGKVTSVPFGIHGDIGVEWVVASDVLPEVGFDADDGCNNIS